MAVGLGVRRLSLKTSPGLLKNKSAQARPIVMATQYPVAEQSDFLPASVGETEVAGTLCTGKNPLSLEAVILADKQHNNTGRYMLDDTHPMRQFPLSSQAVGSDEVLRLLSDCYGPLLAL